jgi:hypothetical protein
VDALEQAVRTKKLVAVIVGSSGSGKSSALFAGLLPRLREDGYQFAIFRPGTQPFYALAGALLPLLEPGLSETDRLARRASWPKAAGEEEISLAEVVSEFWRKTLGIPPGAAGGGPVRGAVHALPDDQLQAAFVDELLRTVEAAKAAAGTGQPSSC